MDFWKKKMFWVPDDKLLAAVGEDGALNVVLEVGELSDKFETLLCKDAGHQETLDEKCEAKAAHCQWKLKQWNNFSTNILRR